MSLGKLGRFNEAASCFGKIPGLILKDLGAVEREDIEEALERKKDIYICGECGAFLSETAEFCEMCGLIIEKEIE